MNLAGHPRLCPQRFARLGLFNAATADNLADLRMLKEVTSGP